MREVIDFLWDYRAKWRLIGIQLGIGPGDLDAIDINTKNVEHALYEVTKKWLYGANPMPNRTMLTEAIESKSVAGEITSSQGNTY